ncbi:hypothetical protein HELRODRAFT_188306 [Helobdella robusta]|uniref:Uncharacterized protein n=1 Tax=Helobdella robusta TaxID=6412 RepID=T1FPU8_HELRO|nr:hypothetical protein HELRODRAFT_188306 [Helobdella robusta]ESO06246.1 hypothetical protein HELRODRAFT_188306 [Helobdella robusta]
MDGSEGASTCGTPSHVKRLNNKRMNGSKNRQRHDEPSVSATTKATNNSHKNNNYGNNRCNNGNKIIVSCSSSVNNKTTSIFISSSANANPSNKNNSRCNSINDSNNLISSIKCNVSVNKINNVNKIKQNNQDPVVASGMLTGRTKVLTCLSTNTVCTIDVSSITTYSSITTTAILTVCCSTISTNTTNSKDSSIKISKSYGLHSLHNKVINNFSDRVKNDNNNNIINNINIDKDVSTSKFFETFDTSVSNICNNAATVGNNNNNNNNNNNSSSSSSNNEQGIIQKDLKSVTANVSKNLNSNRHLDVNFTRSKDDFNFDNIDLYIPDEFECLNDNIGFSLVKQKKKNNNHNSGKKTYKYHSSGSNRNPVNSNLQQLMVPSSRYSLESCNVKKSNNTNSSGLKAKGKSIKIGLTDVLSNGFCSDNSLFDDDGCKGDQNGDDQMNCDIINNRVFTSSANVINDIINPHTTNKSHVNDDDDDEDEEEEDDDSDNNFNLVNREMLSGSFESCLSSMSSVSSISNNCSNAGVSNNCSDNICHNSFIPCSRARNNDNTEYSSNDNVVFTKNVTGPTTNLTSATNKHFSVTSSSSLDNTKYSRSIHCRSSNFSCHSSQVVNNDNNDNIFTEDASETKGSKLDVLSSFCDNIDITFKTSLHLTTNTTAFTTCCCSTVSTTNSTNSQQKTDFFNTQHKLLYAPLDADFTFGDFAANVLVTTSLNYVNPISTSTKIFANTSNQNILKPSPLSNVHSSFTNFSTTSDNSTLQTFLTTLTSVLSNTCSTATQPIFTAPNNFINSRFAIMNDDSVTNFSNNSTSTQTTTFSLTTSSFTSLVSSPTISVKKSLATHKLPPVEFLYSSYVPCSNFDVTFGSGLEDLVKEMKLIDEINNKMNCISCHNFSENNLKCDSNDVDQTSIPSILPTVVTSKQDLQMSLNGTSCLYKDVNFNTKTDCNNSDSSVMKTSLLTTVALANVPTEKFPLSNGFVKDMMVSGNKDLSSSSVMILTLPQTVITISSSVTSSTSSSSSMTSPLSLAAENKLLQNVVGDLHKMDELDDCFTSLLSSNNKNIDTSNYVTDNKAVNINNLNAAFNSSDSRIASNITSNKNNITCSNNNNITCSNNNATSGNKDVASNVIHSGNSKTTNGNNFKSSNSFMQPRSEKSFNLTAAQKFLHDSFQKSYNLYIANRPTQHTAHTVDDSNFGNSMSSWICYFHPQLLSSCKPFYLASISYPDLVCSECLMLHIILNWVLSSQCIIR